MAQCLFNDLCQRRGLPYRAASAGLYARDGDTASDGAFYVMKERGLSLNRHTARQLTRSLAADARLVVAMGESLAEAIRMRFPGVNVTAFRPSIADPFGADLSAYRRTADELESRMDWVLSQL
jgi:protein-tyrosine-phosphatase